MAHNSSVKGLSNRADEDKPLSPAMRGRPYEVAARMYEMIKGDALRKQLKKNKSGSSPL